jgi:4-aminobutyrate aminotransferase-like enzyme
VADEVQAGHGRSGEHLWSFAGYGITPDLVTLGKPMGNGYPVAAVVTRRQLAERFAHETEYFSTFGGNPVAAAAAVAVLDVIDDERLVEHAKRVGARLRRALEPIAPRYGLNARVRGRGLLVGVEVWPAEDGRSGSELAQAIVEGMRDRNVLIGRTGPRADVLKIRPPLAFGDAHVGHVADAMDETMAVISRGTPVPG